MISEKIELLGKGLYESIPNVLTLKNIPTASELEYVGNEDFDRTMLETILPQAIEEDINCYDLLEIDYQWICRCLRILNYGPYHTTNAIYCGSCGETSHGEFQVNLNTIGCIPLPEGFVNELTVKRDEFIDYNNDVKLKLPTIRQILNAYKDNAFKRLDGRTNRELARLCYMISALGTKTTLTPVEIKMAIQNEFSSADYKILVSTVSELANYGLRAGGSTVCPKCKSKDAAFIALVDDRFFRPTLGNLREWRNSKSSGRDKDIS